MASGAANSALNASNTELVRNKKAARERSINNKKFFIAISECNIEEVNRLFKKIDINYKDEDGCSPLHCAVETGDVKTIKLLLNNGAHPHSKNDDNETPIDIAKRINRSDIVNVLETSLIVANDSNFSEIRTNLEWNKKSTISQDQEIWINPVHGYIYQLKVLMLFLHRGLSCKYSFRLGTEIKEAKKFDDLVFEYIDDNKKVYRLLQAKHKFDECKKITVDKLLADTKGDYSLVKYYYSFKACKRDKFFKGGYIKDVIICTNIDFDFDDLKKSGIEIQKVKEKDDILDVRSNEKESTKYKFTNSMIKNLKYKLNPSESEDEIKYFLKHLVFAVNQPNEEELGQIIKKEIGREIGFLDTENAYNKLLIKMMDLSLGKRSSMFLSHEEGQAFFDDLKKEITVWYNIQDPVASFTGRLNYLEKIHEILMNQLQVCISGMGGIGKTELVRKYIADYGHEYDNQIVWINAESYKSVADSFRQLASDKLNISLKTLDDKEKHITSIIADVYQFFSKGKSLFIFDNAEKYKCKDDFDSGIDQFLPCLSYNCVKPNVIVTSRYQKWPDSIKIVVLEALKADEARALVQKMLLLKNGEQKELIDKLGETLQYLPLALQQAAAYIKMQKEKLASIESDFGISNYLERYSSMTQKLLEFSQDTESIYDKSVFTTWNITFDCLNQKEKGKHALDILNIISYFLPENIPIELLLIFSTNSEKLSSAIGLLKKYSLVSVQHKTLSVNRLVQLVTRIKLQKQGKEVDLLKNTLTLLSKDNVNFKNLDHVISMWKFASKHSQLFDEYSRLSTNIIPELSDIGRLEEAISFGNGVSEVLETSRCGTRELFCTVAVKNNVAMCKLRKGQYAKALEEFRAVNDFQKTFLEPSHPDFLSTKNNIGLALEKLGRNKEALKTYSEVLDAHRKNGVEETDQSVLLVKRSISYFLSLEGKHEEALSMMQEIYDVQRRTLGEYHAKTLVVRMSIGAFLSKMNKDEEALKILEQVRCDQEANLSKDHHDILDTKYNIAEILARQKKYNSALKIYQELHDVHAERYGKDHPHTIDTNVRIAFIWKWQGKHEKALNAFKKSYDELKVILGPVHPNTLQSHEAFAESLYKLEKWTDSLEVYRDLLDQQVSFFGNVHRNTLKTRRYIAAILMEQKKWDLALECCLEVLDNAESIFGKNHSETFVDKSNAGMMYYHVRDFNKASAVLNELLQVQECSYGKDHESCRETRSAIALVRSTQTKYAGGLVELQQMADAGFNFNTKDEEGITMMHMALDAKDERWIEFLLAHGAEVFVTSNKGNTPLHIGVSKGQEKLVKLLLQKAEPGRLKDFVDVRTTSSGSTALHIAAKEGHFGIVKCLLKSHATFCAKDKMGKTPLDFSKNPKVIKFLKMVQELFEDTKKGDATGVTGKLEKLSSEEFLAVTNTRNDRGSTLAQVAILNKQKQTAAQILQMVQKSKAK